MQIQVIFGFIIASIAIRLIPYLAIRRWLMWGMSVFVLFWMQPASPIRYLDFFLPVLILLIGFIGWLSITPRDERWHKINYHTIVFTIILVVLIGSTRYFSVVGIITPSRPPATLLILAPMLGVGVLTLLVRGHLQTTKGVPALLIGFLLVVLLLQKSPALGLQTSIALRSLFGQSSQRAGSFDIRWLGISYIVFRMIHTLVDAKNKRLKTVNLQEYFLYLFFFPAISAGPIDRIQRFLSDLRDGPQRDVTLDFSSAGWRLLIGLLKKFAIADTLALFALNSVNAYQVNQTIWMWVLLYAYSFQILFDFSGYTDIAIGLGRLMGFDLPENFDRPYLKHNLKLFWDHWHMTLTQWFRTYYFNPVSRKLRRQYKKLPVWGMVLLMQLSTMILIGLWHGVTWNFVFWGMWHGIGLFFQNRWSDWLEPKLNHVSKPWLLGAHRVLGIFLTFQFVALGWVWFVLPKPADAFHVFERLLGI